MGRAAGAAGLLGLVLVGARGQEAAPAGAAEQGTTGVVMELEAVGARAGRDARVVDRIALHVAADACPSDFLAPGPFHATWRGRLLLDLRSKLRFALRGRGQARLLLNGAVVLEGGGDGGLDLASEEARFPQGANELLLEYESSKSGDATLRLLWSGRGFDWEPVPAALLFHDPGGEPEALLARRRARENFAARRCVRCHLPEAAGDLAAHGMPELAQTGPDLRDAGARLRPEWLAEWIAAPKGMRPGARMPRLLGGGSLEEQLEAGDTRALDLAAYVATLGADAASVPAPDPKGAEEGGRLFAQRGCIACHTRPDRSDPDLTHDRVPLHRVATKWRPAALVRFLLDPTAGDPWSRMPDLHLEPEEAAALAAFLLARSALVPFPAAGGHGSAAGDAKRGEELYAELGCARCHEGGSPARAKKAPPLDALATAAAAGRGCLAEPAARAPGVPDFELAAPERADLRQFGAEGIASLARRNGADFADRQLRELQCNACHTLGTQHDRWQLLSSEVADLLAGTPTPELDQSRPALTWVGEKLHTDWMARLFAGDLKERTRPWLAARMPAFPQRAALLAQGLAERDGVAPSAAKPESADAATLAAGERLLLEGGFSCVSCHDIGPRKALSRFEFGTPALDLAHARIRPDYYLRWMLNPMRVEPSSKMPRFADTDGSSPIPEECDGDMRRQFEAMRLFMAGLGRGN